jgi:hypothetical protein
LDGQQLVGVEQFARLTGATLAAADAHLSRHHRSGRARARRKQAAFGKQCVQTPLGHRNRTLAHKRAER